MGRRGSCSGPSASCARCAVDAPSRSTTGRSRRARSRCPSAGKALEIKTDLRIGSAKQAGLKVRTGNGEETVIGYDAQTDELYVDRTRAGRVDFSRDFPGSSGLRSPPVTGSSTCASSSTGLRSRCSLTGAAGSSPTRLPQRRQRRARTVRRRRPREAGHTEGPAPRSSWTTGHHNARRPTAGPGERRCRSRRGTSLSSPGRGRVCSFDKERASPLAPSSRPLGTSSERVDRRSAHARFRQ